MFLKSSHILDFGPSRSSSILSTVTPQAFSLVTNDANKQARTGETPLYIKLKIPSALNSDTLGQVESSSANAGNTNLEETVKPTVRSKARCKECGHCLYGNIHKLKQDCPIPEHRRLAKCTCDDFNTKRKRHLGSSHYCEKTRCLLECCRQPE
jgi:hypothetical protein